VLNRDKTGLVCFESFVVDTSLPKHRKATEEASSYDGLSVLSFQGDTGFDFRKRSWWERVVAWFYPIIAMSPIRFFASVKNSAREIDTISNRMESYQNALAAAREAGQVALVEQLEAAAESVRVEAQLVAIKHPRYILEEDLVRFAKRVAHVRLDWIANFTRAIPKRILKDKARMDELCLFDNYVVLHYDPRRKGAAPTNTEKERMKDPILFGVLKGVGRLYFVGDWVDEYCHLTLDEYVAQSGKVLDLEDSAY
jgi:hypothetical protein